MPFKYTKNTVIAEESCTVEDAMTLLEFLITNPKAKVDLAACTHLHTAVLQVLLAVNANINALPTDSFLARWLIQVLNPPLKGRGK